jgi:methyltransferase
MPVSAIVALLTLVATLLVMGGEAILSRYNEHLLRRRGAVEPAGDVYRIMQGAYPACFVAMALEGAVTGPASPPVLIAGLTLFGLAKALKLWAISSLGSRWSFRVLVLPNAPLIADGPYRWLRHPNYVAVIGELMGFAGTVWAPVTGLLACAGFGALILRRIRIEDRALGRQ